MVLQAKIIYAYNRLTASSRSLSRTRLRLRAHYPIKLYVVGLHSGPSMLYGVDGEGLIFHVILNMHYADTWRHGLHVQNRFVPDCHADYGPRMLQIPNPQCVEPSPICTCSWDGIAIFNIYILL
jgi:hypothetical protein